MNDFSNWAQRRAGRGNRPPQNDRAPARQAAPSAQALPPPAPGYAWAIHPQHGYIMVPLDPTPAAPRAPAFSPPPRQPSGLVPFVPQPITSQMPPGHATPRVRS